uniref:MIase like protein n=1 Tax=Thermorudis sp. TaxID=1969470 RepID=A0A7C2WRF3_9BACT
MALFFVRATVTPPADMPGRTLYEIWDREARASLEAMEAGAIKGLWKVAGQRVVVGILDPPGGDAIDQAITSLPIMQEMGPSVSWEVLQVRPYEHFAAGLRKAVSSS